MKSKNYHIGGFQAPLLTPDSSWHPPTELPDLRGRPRLAIDVETRDDSLGDGRGPGWAYGAGYICGVGVAWDDDAQPGGIGSLYVPTRHPEDNYHDPDQVPGWLAEIMYSAKTCVFQNGSYDLGWIAHDYEIKPNKIRGIDDTIAAAVMVDEDRLSYSLDALAKWKNIPGKDERLLKEAAAAYGVNPKEGLYQLPARFVGEYGAQDPRATLQLLDALMPTIIEEDTIDAYRLECELMPMVHVMRQRGIRVDTDGAERAALDLDKQRNVALDELAHHLGKSPGSVTIDHCRSAKQLEQWFSAASLPFPRTEKTRQGSFQAKWMRKHVHPLPRLVARAEQLTEAADKFLRGFILAYAHRGRLHASINQFRSEEGGTRTHRFSYSDPPLQQMPFKSDQEIASVIRGVFLPEEGELWCTADYKQQEYRLIVHYAAAMGLPGGAEAAELYRTNPETDFHQYVADITGLDRGAAKDVNFAKVYGAGVKRLSEMTGRSMDESAEIMNQYDRELPFPKAMNERCSSLAQRRGYVRLLDGARCHFNRWEPTWRDSEYVPPMQLEAAKIWQENQEVITGRRPNIKRAFTKDAMNKVTQGGAARQTKLAMRDCWREGLVPMLQMHDDLNFSVTSETEGLRVKQIMIAVKANELRVPMDVDLEYGVNWGDAAVGRHKWDDLRS